MIIPTIRVQVRRLRGHDKFGQPTWSPEETAMAAPVKVELGQLHTTVRTDSSASHGFAAEDSGDVVLLFLPRVKIKLDDRVTLNGKTLRVTMVHARFDVWGRHDHDEAQLQFAPN